MKKKITLAVIFLLLIAAIIVAVVYFTGHQKVDWKLYGAWISTDGNLGERVELSLTGRIPTFSDKRNTVITKFEIIWPDDFPYENTGKIACGGIQELNVEIPRYFDFSYFALAKTTYEEDLLDFVIFRLYPDEELVVFVFEHYPNSYLVTSTDPNADLLQLLEDSGLIKST